MPLIKVTRVILRREFSEDGMNVTYTAHQRDHKDRKWYEYINTGAVTRLFRKGQYTEIFFIGDSSVDVKESVEELSPFFQ